MKLDKQAKIKTKTSSISIFTNSQSQSSSPSISFIQHLKFSPSIRCKTSDSKFIPSPQTKSSKNLFSPISIKFSHDQNMDLAEKNIIINRVKTSSLSLKSDFSNTQIPNNLRTMTACARKKKNNNFSAIYPGLLKLKAPQDLERESKLSAQFLSPTFTHFMHFCFILFIPFHRSSFANAKIHLDKKAHSVTSLSCEFPDNSPKSNSPCKTHPKSTKNVIRFEKVPSLGHPSPKKNVFFYKIYEKD